MSRSAEEAGVSVVSRIAHFQGRRDEVPNQELARELAAARDRAGIGEIAANLRNPDRRIQGDCVKVLYEVGYLDPALIAPHTEELLELLRSGNNRLAWGGMIALVTVAPIEADRLFRERALIRKAIESGSVITVDNGIRALALVAAKRDSYCRELFPYLAAHLATCRDKDVPQHAESILVAVREANRATFVALLERRLAGMPASRAARLRRVIRVAMKRPGTA